MNAGCCQFVAALCSLVHSAALCRCVQLLATDSHPSTSAPVQVLWAHARSDVQPPAPLLAALLQSASQQLHRFSGRDAAMLLWTLAALGRPPGQQLLQGLLQSLMLSSCKLEACAPQVGSRLEHMLACVHG